VQLGGEGDAYAGTQPVTALVFRVPEWWNRASGRGMCEFSGWAGTGRTGLT